VNYPFKSRGNTELCRLQSNASKWHVSREQQRAQDRALWHIILYCISSLNSLLTFKCI